MVINKKAEEKYLSIWWIFVLVIIGGGIVLAVAIYYSGGINSNQLEADILANKIFDCISEKGYVNQKILDNNYDIFSECSIDKRIFQPGGSFFMKFSIYKNGTLINESFFGDRSFEADCSIGAKVSGKDFPSCSNKTENFYDSEYDLISINILTACKNKGEKTAIVG